MGQIIHKSLLPAKFLISAKDANCCMTGQREILITPKDTVGHDYNIQDLQTLETIGLLSHHENDTGFLHGYVKIDCSKDRVNPQCKEVAQNHYNYYRDSVEESLFMRFIDSGDAMELSRAYLTGYNFSILDMECEFTNFTPLNATDMVTDYFV